MDKLEELLSSSDPSSEEEAMNESDLSSAEMSSNKPKKASNKITVRLDNK